mgnify:CR=1 FL=1
MMKKRIFALLLTVCMLLSLMPLGAFAEENSEDIQVLAEGENEDEGEGEGGKNNDSHEHTFGEWKDNGNGTCTKACTHNGCIESVTEAHVWSGSVKPNGNGTHSHVCERCGAKDTAAACTEGTAATCKEPAKCAECGGYIGEVSKEHQGGVTYTSNGDGTHTGTYTICGHSFTEDCTAGNEADCTHRLVCKVCKGEFGDYKHNWSDTPRHIENTKTHEYYCLDCTATRIAEACTPKAVSNKDGTHNVVCAVCGATLETNVKCAYDPAAAVCGQQPVCKDCGVAYGEPLKHDLDGNNVCKRIATGKCVCKTDHKGLWKAENASQNTVKCTECGKSVEKESVSVAFTLSGYKVGAKVSSLGASSSSSSHVKVTNVSVSPDGEDTFQAGTSYTITVEYTLDPGYKVSSATINGAPALLTDNKATASLSTLEVEYSITYDLAGGKLPAGKTNPTTYTKSSSFTLVNPTRTGYDFAGWKGTGLDQATMTVTVPAGSTGNRGYTATWTVKSYTVTFDVQGHGTAPKAQTVNYGKKAATPKDPTESGYAFGGWYKDAACKQKFSFSTKITENIILYAKWDEAYTLKFHTNGGNTINSINAAKGSTVELKKYKPSRSGYYFVGWYRTKDLKSGTQVSWQHMTDTYADSDGVIHVYAKWKKMDTTNPKTGDSSFPELAAGLLALSALSLGAVTLIGKKKRNW